MRLIDADALMNTLQELFDQREKEQKFAGSRGSCVTWNDAIYQIKSAPTVDAAPLVHGEWIMFERPNGGYYKGCSLCTYPMPTDMELDYLCEEDNRYCYNCGAKMDGEVKNDEQTI